MLALLLSQGRGGNALESGLVRSIDLEPLPGTFVQHFRLDRAGAREGEPPLGFLRYVAGPDREGGEFVELDLQMLAEETTVVHTEQTNALRRRLVFREVRERGGRTLFLEDTSGRGFTGYELGGPEVVRRELSEGLLPLSLIEAARAGCAPPEEAVVLDPLGACVEPLRIVVRAEGVGRTLEARRGDGSLRWRVNVNGELLGEWRFQERGPVARPISPEEYTELRTKHELDTSAAREAAAERERSPRRR